MHTFMIKLSTNKSNMVQPCQHVFRGTNVIIIKFFYLKIKFPHLRDFEENRYQGTLGLDVSHLRDVGPRRMSRGRTLKARAARWDRGFRRFILSIWHEFDASYRRWHPIFYNNVVFIVLLFFKRLKKHRIQGIIINDHIVLFQFFVMLHQVPLLKHSRSFRQ